MNSINEQLDDVLVPLGAVTDETKGGLAGQDDGIGQQVNAGLTND